MNYEFLEQSRDRFMEQYNSAPIIFVSKGENRPFVERSLDNLGLAMPEFAGRCLHGELRR